MTATPERKNMNNPDEVRRMEKTEMELVTTSRGDVARFNLQPGWRWSTHVKPNAGTEWCDAPHAQYIISGRIGLKMASGEEMEGGPGDVLIIPAGHDGWVIGDEPLIGVDWGGMHDWGKAHG